MPKPIKKGTARKSFPRQPASPPKTAAPVAHTPIRLSPRQRVVRYDSDEVDASAGASHVSGGGPRRKASDRLNLPVRRRQDGTPVNRRFRPGCGGPTVSRRRCSSGNILVPAPNNLPPGLEPITKSASRRQSLSFEYGRETNLMNRRSSCDESSSRNLPPGLSTVSKPRSSYPSFSYAESYNSRIANRRPSHNEVDGSNLPPGLVPIPKSRHHHFYSEDTKTRNRQSGHEENTTCNLPPGLEVLSKPSRRRQSFSYEDSKLESRLNRHSSYSEVSTSNLPPGLAPLSKNRNKKHSKEQSFSDEDDYGTKTSSSQSRICQTGISNLPPGFTSMPNTRKTHQSPFGKDRPIMKMTHRQPVNRDADTSNLPPGLASVSKKDRRRSSLPDGINNFEFTFKPGLTYLPVNAIRRRPKLKNAHSVERLNLPY